MDFFLDRALDHHQHEAQVDGYVDFLGAHGDMAVDSGAAEVKRIAGPFVFDIELFGDVRRNPFHRFLCIFEGLAVGALYIDAGHEYLSGT